MRSRIPSSVGMVWLARSRSQVSGFSIAFGFWWRNWYCATISAAGCIRLRQERSLVMTEHFLVKLFEHNNWANSQIIQACSALSDEQLDAEPTSTTKGSIRRTLVHLVNSQHGYLSLLTLPVEARRAISPAFAELQQAASISGAGLLAFGRESNNEPRTQLP